MRTRVKVCGITRVEDALQAAKCGVDAIGFVFYKPSPRYISPEVAKTILDDLPAFVTTVGLFVDASEDYVKDILNHVRIDCLQFHGDESAEYCRRFGLPYIKAIRVRSNTNLLQCAVDYDDANALLLDTYQEGVPGGTGATFNWKLIPSVIANKIILAGGLDETNIASAIETVKPYAVDVSGGVELKKGIKSADKISAFIRGVNDASL